MSRLHAPNRCDTRATRIAKVKFVVLPMELTADAAAVTPAQAGAQSGVVALFAYLRAYLIRVISRLEAARP